MTQAALGPLEPVGDVVVGVRRWIASCCAAAAGTRGVRLPLAPEQVAALIFPDVDRVSEDTLLSIEALLAEERDLGPSLSDVPGFRGPDEWFRHAPPKM